MALKKELYALATEREARIRAPRRIRARGGAASALESPHQIYLDGHRSRRHVPQLLPENCCSGTNKCVATNCRIIGTSDQHGWNGEFEDFGCLEIDHELELCWLLDRQVVSDSLITSEGANDSADLGR